MSSFTESVVKQPAFAWLERRGWATAHGADIAPDTPGAKALDDVFRKRSHPEEDTR